MIGLPITEVLHTLTKQITDDVNVLASNTKFGRRAADDLNVNQR
jgi:hypothetical protein